MKKVYMQTKTTAGLVILTLLLIIGAFYLGKASNNSSTATRGTKYIFAPKDYSDNTEAGVYIAGTLTGDDATNNTTQITCSKDRMQCLTNQITGISTNACQLSRLDAPLSIPITTWNDSVIIATTYNPIDNWSCSKITINIDRKSQTAEWIQESINQSQPFCKDSDTKTYKWMIEDPAWAKEMHQSLSK
jgi:hypothetical protein